MPRCSGIPLQFYSDRHLKWNFHSPCLSKTDATNRNSNPARDNVASVAFRFFAFTDAKSWLQLNKQPIILSHFSYQPLTSLNILIAVSPLLKLPRKIKRWRILEQISVSTRANTHLALIIWSLFRPTEKRPHWKIRRKKAEEKKVYHFVNLNFTNLGILAR